MSAASLETVAPPSAHALAIRRTANVSAAVMTAIVRAAAFDVGVPASLVYSGLQRKAVVRARFAAIWAIRHATRASLPTIATHLGYTHHSQVLYALGRAELMRDRDAAFHLLTTRLADATDARRRISQPYSVHANTSADLTLERTPA